MPRQLRLEYPGAIYHLMNRGDRREPIFKHDLDVPRINGDPFMNADPDKVRIARRLRGETTVTLRWIADELSMGAWTYLSNNLSRTTGRPSR